MRKAAIYCRLSEEDRHKARETDDSESIQNQKAMLTQYAKEQGWEVVGVYSDDDYAGTDRSRPAFRRLLRDAELRRFDIVLCKTQSRFTRELELVEKYLHNLFPRWGIRFVSIVDNADTENRGNKKARQINGLVNEWYLEDMSDNIKSVLTARRKNGLHIGSFALYGYRKDPAHKGRLLIDEGAAAVVRQVFSLYAAGFGQTAIARMLNARGIPNPATYKRLQGLRYHTAPSRDGTEWHYASISSMLHNEMYRGSMVQGRYGSISYKSKINRPRSRSLWYVVPHTHEAIIDGPLWDRVQSLLAQRTHPFTGGEIGLFAGKIYCRTCGRTLRSTQSRGVRYLQCPTRRMNKAACPGAFLPVAPLEQAVLTELQALLERHLDQDALTAAWRQAERKSEAAAAARQTTARQQAAACDRALQTLYLDKLRGVVDEDLFQTLSARLTDERRRFLQARSVAPPVRTDPPLTCARLDRAILDTLIDHLTVGPRTSGSREVPVEIYWKF